MEKYYPSRPDFMATVAEGNVLRIYSIGSGSDVLRERCRPITRFGRKLKILARDMVKTMEAAGGIGIAAPQVGESVSLCIVDVSSLLEGQETCKLDGQEFEIGTISPMCLINPKIIKFSRETSTHSEGCLSIPKVHGRVTRPEFVCVRYTDLQNRQHEIEGQGILARCMQHEIDHLHGILFTDRIVP